MKLAVEEQLPYAEVFAPDEDSLEPDWRSGAARKVEPCEAMPLLWPKATKERRELFDVWHAIGMKVVGDVGASFRLMAVVRRFLHWETGTLWPTSATLAAIGGECSERTIKRDIATYRDLGLFIVDHKSRRDPSGQLKKRRLIRLAVPVEMSPEMPIHDADEGDTRCPHGCPENECHHGDTCCPSQGDTRCPLTLEEPMKGSDPDAA